MASVLFLAPADLGETVLATVLFVSVILYIRVTRGPQEGKAAPAN